jgi:hypothetical protein
MNTKGQPVPLLEPPLECTSCGQVHAGIFDLAFAKPDVWQGAEDYAPNDAVLTSRNFLSEDFCVMDGEHYFVRCVLPIPILARAGEQFAYGVWSTLSEKNFRLYVKAFSSDLRDQLGPWFGWFSNRIKGYPDTLNLKCQVHPQGERMRPLIELESVAHPLVREAEDGIGLDRLVDIYRTHGHSVSLSLTNFH